MTKPINIIYEVIYKKIQGLNDNNNIVCHMYFIIVF